jgi:hypothetical protein
VLVARDGVERHERGQEPRRPPRQPVVLNADDVPAFPERPAAIDKKRDDIPHGKLEMLSYESKAVGTTGRSKRISSISLNRPRRAADSSSVLKAAPRGTP